MYFVVSIRCAAFGGQSVRFCALGNSLWMDQTIRLLVIHSIPLWSIVVTHFSQQLNVWSVQ